MESVAKILRQAKIEKIISRLQEWKFIIHTMMERPRGCKRDR